MRREAFVEIAPKPYTRTRSGRGKVYTDDDYRAYRLDLSQKLQRALGVSDFDAKVPIAVEIEVSATGLLVAVWDVERFRPVGMKGDVDNYGKAVLDSLQDRAYRKGPAVIRNDYYVQDVRTRFREETE